MCETSFDLPDCLRRLRLRDDEAARQLIEHVYPQVMRIIAAKLPRRDAPEDLAQEIFLKMFTKLEQYRGDVPFEHWVSRIAVNHCLNAIRAQRSRPEWRWADLTPEQTQTLDAVLTSSSDAPHPSQALAARELVDKLLAELDPADRWLIQLLELEECPIEQISSLTGWSSTRIRVRAFRARRKLNKTFQLWRKQGKV
ncbi:MAG TPA: RNA polymerase sigma factor [Verrucomicrobiae bacterium]|nr:RNA polymerase sigma factor [Verrucomicrobiae bacterium]